MALWAAILGAAHPVIAEPSDRTESVRQAQAQWRKGAKAATRGDYETARAAFEQAYELTEEPSLLFALGDAEVRTGNFLEGSRHLATFLATQAGTPAQRDAATKALAKASSHVARLSLRISTSDADVLVDGDILGRTPLQEAIAYLSPGRHVVQIEKANHTPMKKAVELAPGQLEVIDGDLIPLPSEATPSASEASPIARPAPAPTLAASSNGSSLSEPPPPMVDRSVSARTVAIVSGSVLTAAALGIGVTFFLKKESALNDRDAALQSIGSGNCRNPGLGQTTACSQLANSATAIADDNKVANWVFPAAGVLGAATLAAAIFWPHSSSNRIGATLVPLPQHGAIVGATAHF